MRIDFTNAVVEDDGYGVEVNGRSLEAIISTALGTRLGDKGGYSSGLPRFKANSCDVTTVDTLVKLNGIKNKNLINIGQVIKLP